MPSIEVPELTRDERLQRIKNKMLELLPYQPTHEQLNQFYASENLCVVCGVIVETMTWRNTGVCSDKHRKARDGEDKSFYGTV